MPKFMKRPLAIEAWQVPNRDAMLKLADKEQVPSWVLATYRRGRIDWREQNKFTIETGSGVAHGKTGDYLVQSAINPDDVYPINRAEFDATYEAYDDTRKTEPESRQQPSGKSRPGKQDAAPASSSPGDDASGLQPEQGQPGGGHQGEDGKPS